VLRIGTADDRAFTLSIIRRLRYTLPAQTELSDDQLKNLIDNHRRHKATSAPAYLEALRELQIRGGIPVFGRKWDQSD
jgi:hypothetical protein